MYGCVQSDPSIGMIEQFYQYRFAPISVPSQFLKGRDHPIKGCISLSEVTAFCTTTMFSGFGNVAVFLIHLGSHHSLASTRADRREVRAVWPTGVGQHRLQSSARTDRLGRPERRMSSAAQRSIARRGVDCRRRLAVGRRWTVQFVNKPGKELLKITRGMLDGCNRCGRDAVARILYSASHDVGPHRCLPKQVNQLSGVRCVIDRPQTGNRPQRVVQALAQVFFSRMIGCRSAGSHSRHRNVLDLG
jgi:hypothetical protein